jgi:hypothetical protein
MRLSSSNQPTGNQQTSETLTPLRGHGKRRRRPPRTQKISGTSTDSLVEMVVDVEMSGLGECLCRTVIHLSGGHTSRPKGFSTMTRPLAASPTAESPSTTLTRASARPSIFPPTVPAGVSRRRPANFCFGEAARGETAGSVRSPRVLKLFTSATARSPGVRRVWRCRSRRIPERPESSRTACRCRPGWCSLCPSRLGGMA